MTEHPILFSGPMIRAILDGRKSQTRRVLRWPDAPCTDQDDDGWPIFEDDVGIWHPLRCPYGGPGDKLWVRETHRQLSGPDWGEHQRGAPIEYKATGYTKSDIPWRPSIHMPRWASRITLEVTEVRVERVREIGPEDAIAEGLLQSCGEVRPAITEYSCGDGFWTTKPRTAFIRLWDSVNGKKYPWDSNPWVWVVGFKRLTTEDTA